MDAVEEVKSRLNIEDVIGEYVQLKRAGRNFRGLSPFTSEKTPSFMVSPEKQIWHDFSSGKGGNVFSFVMEMEGMDFKGALELLAKKAGVDLDQYKTGRSKTLSKEKEKASKALELATKFYQAHFSKNKDALEYVLNKRGFSKETALKFMIGYAPNNGDALVNFLRSKHIPDKDMKLAGLTTDRMKGLSDMFRGRIMIPLCDPQGKVIGFTARILEDQPNAPKYINTPQTVLYDKSRHVYGLNFAKDSIRKSEFSVLVEGNLDVIASHQAGVENVVATAGTALTEFQLKNLKRFAGEVRIAFDQDRAGIQAAERSIPIAAKTDIQLSVITIPEGKDPDELIKKDKLLWEKAINNPKTAVDWLIDLYQQQLDLNTATGKGQFSSIIMNVIGGVGDSVEQEHYIEKVAGIIGVTKEALLSKQSSATQKTNLKKSKVVPQKITEDVEQIKYQNHFLAICFMKAGLRKYLKNMDETMFSEDSAREVFRFINNHMDFSGDETQLKELRNISDYVKMLSLQYETLYKVLDDIEQEYEARRLRTRLIENYVKNQKTNLAAELTEASDKKTNELLEKVKALDVLLRESKEKV